MTRAAVFGAGSWGTAFAQILAEAGASSVSVWARREAVASAIAEAQLASSVVSVVVVAVGAVVVAVAVAGRVVTPGLVTDDDWMENEMLPVVVSSSATTV